MHRCRVLTNINYDCRSFRKLLRIWLQRNMATKHLNSSILWPHVLYVTGPIGPSIGMELREGGYFEKLGLAKISHTHRHSYKLRSSLSPILYWSRGTGIQWIPVAFYSCQLISGLNRPFTPEFKKYILPTFSRQMYKWGSENWYSSIIMFHLSKLWKAKFFIPCQK